MELHLNGKTAVITGGSQGLGRAMASALASEGVKVFVTARNADLLDNFKKEVISAGGPEPITFIQDFIAPDAALNIQRAALSSLGSVDILINNTGRSRAMDIIGTEEDWKAAMTLDFISHRKLTEAFLPHMMERKQGSILFVTSTYELRSVNGSAVAKAAIAAWAKQLAGQLGTHGIRVNCLQPGLFDTENTHRIFTPAQRKQFAAAEIPLGDFGEPEDFASMATFLVSPKARYITGTVAVVDGGLNRYAF
jgi:3-oxoacyl-[acyl-carrier protein] reductase